MTRPFRRHHRSPDGRRPVLPGDFTDDRTIAEALRAAAPAPWDGTTVPLSALRGEPHYAPAGPRPYVPLPAPPPLTVVSVTTGYGADAADQAAARLHAALTYIRLKVAILESAGHAGRIDDAEHARRRGDPIAPRSEVGGIRRESAALLLGAGTR